MEDFTIRTEGLFHQHDIQTEHMYKKLLLIPFMVLIAMIILDLCDDTFTQLFSGYLLSLSFLGLAIVMYPVDFKFKQSADFIFLTVKAVAVFNWFNLFFFQDFSAKINSLNVLSGSFGILLLLARKKQMKNKTLALTRSSRAPF